MACAYPDSDQEEEIVDLHTSPTLNRFLEELHQQHCVSQLPQEVVNDVKEAVEELVWKLVEGVSNSEKYPFLRHSKILSRGSFYEGTKIGLPDEFDFLVELEMLSRPGEIVFTPECSECPGSVHLYLTDEGLHRMITEHHQSKVPKYLSPLDITFIHYSHGLKESCENCYPGASETPCLAQVSKRNGILSLRDNIRYEFKSPNFVLPLSWTTTTLSEDHPNHTFPLTVDVTPAIVYRYHDESNDSDEMLGHVVPAIDIHCKKLACWRISHSVEESRKIESLSEGHKKVCQVLKCLWQKPDEDVLSVLSRLVEQLIRPLEEKTLITGTERKIILLNKMFQSQMTRYEMAEVDKESKQWLSSFMLKTAVLYHADRCESGTEMGACLVDITKDLLRYAVQGHLPGYFEPSKNCFQWFREEAIHEGRTRAIHEALEGLLKVKSYEDCQHVLGIMAPWKFSASSTPDQNKVAIGNPLLLIYMIVETLREIATSPEYDFGRFRSLLKKIQRFNATGRFCMC